jgi:hypothetical protein
MDDPLFMISRACSEPLHGSSLYEAIPVLWLTWCQRVLIPSHKWNPVGLSMTKGYDALLILSACPYKDQKERRTLPTDSAVFFLFPCSFFADLE